MTLKFKGKVWIFGDNLDVDKDIIPFRKMNLGLITFDNLGDWCMTNIDNDFPRNISSCQLSKLDCPVNLLKQYTFHQEIKHNKQHQNH